MSMFNPVHLLIKYLLLLNVYTSFKRTVQVILTISTCQSPSYLFSYPEIHKFPIYQSKPCHLFPLIRINTRQYNSLSHHQVEFFLMFVNDL
jgi:hypothetical protein